MADVTEPDINNFTKAGVEVYNLLTGDEAVIAAENMDEAYEAFKKHAEISREDFQKIVDKYMPMIENDSVDSGMELTEDELDMVVGGSIGSWFKKAYNSVKETVSETWDSSPKWVKSIVIGMAVGAALGTGFGLVYGTMISAGVIATTLISGSVGAAMGGFITAEIVSVAKD